MKAILRSIKPYWLYLILIGKKTVEVGKTAPKSDEWSGFVYLYCSQDAKSFRRIPAKDQEWMRKYLGKVVCAFACGEIQKGVASVMSHCDSVSIGSEETCLSIDEIFAYLGIGVVRTVGTQAEFFAWRISDLVVYEKPKELYQFSKVGFGRVIPLKRPPQSWMYVEEIA